MKNNREYRAAKGLVEDFKNLANSLETSGDFTDVEKGLSVCSKKLAVFGKEFGTTNKLFKQLDILKDQISIKVDENKELGNFY